ncbi:hypothetical protein ACG1P5_00355 [Lactiplantibacillus plantarum]|uniref:hypothetical protein n=1 Tax=Lactiplantibacillus plantarum TaxID=1590 RepID=UPI0026566D51|nr:hypothetical protein [Lactiplantibacillus plantarum]
MDPELLKSVSDFVPNTTKEQLFNPTANAIGRGVGGIFAWIFKNPIWESHLLMSLCPSKR